jgi:nitrite reductase/ring-hydroxylating ferredoxin subunit
MRDREHMTIAPDRKPADQQPQWRQDFPIDLPQDEYVSRREFTKFMVLISFAFAIGQLWILVQNYWRKSRGLPPLLKIVDLREIAVGASKVFDYPGPHEPCVLVRVDRVRFLAYSQNCTHLSCPIIPKVQQGQFHCPCHEGVFDMATGEALAGPPHRKLIAVKLEVRNGAVYAAGMEERT